MRQTKDEILDVPTPTPLRTYNACGQQVGLGAHGRCETIDQQARWTYWASHDLPSLSWDVMCCSLEVVWEKLDTPRCEGQEFRGGPRHCLFAPRPACDGLVLALRLREGKQHPVPGAQPGMKSLSGYIIGRSRVVNKDFFGKSFNCPLENGVQNA
jgi:hypothetical protein